MITDFKDVVDNAKLSNVREILAGDPMAAVEAKNYSDKVMYFKQALESLMKGG